MKICLAPWYFCNAEICRICTKVMNKHKKRNASVLILINLVDLEKVQTRKKNVLIANIGADGAED